MKVDVEKYIETLAQPWPGEWVGRSVDSSTTLGDLSPIPARL